MRCYTSEGLTVAALVDGALAEDHDVLGEGASLVRENVLHLPELLVQGGGARLGRHAPFPAVHLLVPVDEIAVPQTDHLHTGPIEHNGAETQDRDREMRCIFGLIIIGLLIVNYWILFEPFVILFVW